MSFDFLIQAVEIQPQLLAVLLENCACWIQQGAEIQYSSPALAGLCGMEKSELERDPGKWLSLLPAATQSQLRSAPTHIWEFYFETAVGEGRWLRISPEPIATDQYLCLAQDVTVQQKLERTLHEGFWQTLFKNSHDGVALLDEDGRVLFISDSIVEVHGFHAHERLGAFTFDRIHPEDLSLARSVFAHARQDTEHKIWKAEVRVLHKNGSWRWVNCHVQNLLANAVIRAIVVNYHDIHEAKIAQLKEQSQQEQLETLVNTIDGIVWEAEPDPLRFTFISEQTLRILGYPVMAWYEMGFWESLLAPDDAEQVIMACRSQAALGQSHTLVYRLRHAKGHYIWVRDDVSVIIKAGKIHALRGVMVDVSARYEAEERLRQTLDELEHMYQALTARDLQLKATLESMGEGLLVFNCLGEIILSNPAAKKILSTEPDNWLILAQSLVPIQQFSSGLHLLLEQVLAGKSFDNLPLLQDQTEMLWTFSPLWDAQLQPMGMVATFRNITALRRIAWLQSHEVRRPLANILGLSSLLALEPETREAKRLQLLLRQEVECLDQILHQIVATTHEAIHPVH
jgi:PAS domain S-box-containing protein